MRLSILFPSKWLRAADLDGKEHAIIIDRLDAEVFGEDGEKPVLYFQGRKKGLVLNKTNAFAIGEDYGDDTLAWKGKPLTLYATRVEFKGKVVDSIRVRISAPPQTAQP